VTDPVEQFTVLYDRNYRNVLGYALLRAGQDAAEDVVSETFLVAWRRLDDLPEPVLPWLLGVARNLLHKQYDSGRRRQVLADRITAATTPGTWPVPTSPRPSRIGRPPGPCCRH
jgi:DNA-directed RNA polymerase specialized sigma24 family protein